MASIGSLEHSYTPAVVGKFTLPSRFVELKAKMRVRNEPCPVAITGVSSGVMHFKVTSDTDRFHDHRVEYDMMHKTFRCQCEAGFYGNHCHHVQMILDTVRLP